MILPQQSHLSQGSVASAFSPPVCIFSCKSGTLICSSSYPPTCQCNIVILTVNCCFSSSLRFCQELLDSSTEQGHINKVNVFFFDVINKVNVGEKCQAPWNCFKHKPRTSLTQNHKLMVATPIFYLNPLTSLVLSDVDSTHV